MSKGRCTYEPIAEREVPLNVRFDVPRRNQGQMIEIAYGGTGRYEHDDGDAYKRIFDASDRITTYYRRRCRRA